MVLVRHSAKVDYFSLPLLLQLLSLHFLGLLGLLHVLGLDLVLDKPALYVVLDVCLFPLQSLEFFLSCFFLLDLVLGFDSFLSNMHRFLFVLGNCFCIFQGSQVVQAGSLGNKTKAYLFLEALAHLELLLLGLNLLLFALRTFFLSLKSVDSTLDKLELEK